MVKSVNKTPQTKEELIDFLAQLGSFRAVARLYGCSHTTIVKKAKKWGVSPVMRINEVGSNQYNSYVPHDLKILFLDIETSPNIAEVWGLWRQNISLQQLKESGRMICFAARFKGQKKMHFYSEYHHGKDEMLLKAHELMEEADVIVHYNGNKFDIPFLNKEFLVNGFLPPKPSKQIDLYRVAKKHFKLPSYKLDYLASILGIDGKLAKDGYHTLWAQCSLGSNKAWQCMKKYNIQDVIILTNIYYELLPWITNHPNHGLYQGKELCPNCGSDNLKDDGFAFTDAGAYHQKKCYNCGTWIRGRNRISTSEVRQTKY